VRRHGAELGGVAAVQPGAIRFLAAQSWPRNVRQLENVVKRVLLLARGYSITEELAQATLFAGPALGVLTDVNSRTLAALCEEALKTAGRSPGLGAFNIAPCGRQGRSSARSAPVSRSTSCRVL